MTYTFRFDDISVNTDEDKLRQMTFFLKKRLNPVIMLAVSPLVHSLSTETGLARERVFPKLFHTHSDHRVFYSVDNLGIPKTVREISNLAGWQVAAHGLIHVDHRLLSRKTQELSIVTSCALLDTDLFVPPFHKWNKKTQEICHEHNINIVYHDGWRHLAYHPFSPDHSSYYLHTHDFTYEQFVSRFP